MLLIPLNEYELSQEPYCQEHRRFIETYEWLGTVGNTPKWVYTARARGLLAGVVMINEPNSYSSIIEDPIRHEALIQRGACASWAHQHLGSRLIMYSIRHLVRVTTKRLFIAYSDPAAKEIGTIYHVTSSILDRPLEPNASMYTLNSRVVSRSLHKVSGGPACLRIGSEM